MLNWLKKKLTASGQQAHGGQSDDSTSLIERGREAMSGGNMAEAQRQLNRAILLDPRNPHGFYLLGTIAHKQGDLQRAIEHFNEALDIQPDLEIVFGDLAAVYLDAGQLNNAERSLKLNPHFETIFAGLASLYFFNWKQAVILDVVQKYPERAVFYYCLGNLHHGSDQLDFAETNFREAIAIREDYAEAHSNLGHVLVRQGRLTQAGESFRRAIALNPNYFDACSNFLWTLSFSSEMHVREYLAEARHLAPRLRRKPGHTLVGRSATMPQDRYGSCELVLSLET